MMNSIIHHQCYQNSGQRQAPTAGLYQMATFDDDEIQFIQDIFDASTNQVAFGVSTDQEGFDVIETSCAFQRSTRIYNEEKWAADPSRANLWAGQFPEIDDAIWLERTIINLPENSPGKECPNLSFVQDTTEDQINVALFIEASTSWSANVDDAPWGEIMDECYENSCDDAEFSLKLTMKTTSMLPKNDGIKTKQENIKKMTQCETNNEEKMLPMNVAHEDWSPGGDFGIDIDGAIWLERMIVNQPENSTRKEFQNSLFDQSTTTKDPMNKTSFTDTAILWCTNIDDAKQQVAEEIDEVKNDRIKNKHEIKQNTMLCEKNNEEKMLRVHEAPEDWSPGGDFGIDFDENTWADLCAEQFTEIDDAIWLERTIVNRPENSTRKACQNLLFDQGTTTKDPNDGASFTHTSILWCANIDDAKQQVAEEIDEVNNDGIKTKQGNKKNLMLCEKNNEEKVLHVHEAPEDWSPGGDFGIDFDENTWANLCAEQFTEIDGAIWLERTIVNQPENSTRKACQNLLFDQGTTTKDPNDGASFTHTSILWCANIDDAKQQVAEEIDEVNNDGIKTKQGNKKNLMLCEKNNEENVLHVHEAPEDWSPGGDFGIDFDENTWANLCAEQFTEIDGAIWLERMIVNQPENSTRKEFQNSLFDQGTTTKDPMNETSFTDTAILWCANIDDAKQQVAEKIDHVICLPVQRRRRKCSVSGCRSGFRVNDVCAKHGAKLPLCTFSSGCNNVIVNNFLCIQHGAKRKARKTCSVAGCSKLAKTGDICVRHGSKIPLCSYKECTNVVKRAGFCRRHGEQEQKSVKDCTMVA